MIEPNDTEQPTEQPEAEAPAAAEAKPFGADVAQDGDPAHHDPDYDGPLTIEQAAWRNANIKPQAESSKPAKARTK